MYNIQQIEYDFWEGAIMSLKFGLLGLLNYGPMTGYDLMKVFNDSLQFFWKAQTSQIYRDLASLEKDGFLTFEIQEQVGKPAKKIYTITKKGLDHFLVWLNDYDFTKEMHYRESMLMKIFFSAEGDDKKLEKSLNEFINQNKEYKKNLIASDTIDDYASKNEEMRRHHVYWKMVRARGFVQSDANVQWAEMAIAILNEEIDSPKGIEAKGAENENSSN